MKENQKYKALQKILQKVSLNRRDADWEKMNALLNTHLPVKPPSVSPFHSIKLLAYGGSVVLVTAVTVMVHHGFQKSKNQKTETTHAKQMIQQVDSGRTILLPGIVTESIQKISSDSLYQSRKENIILSDSQLSTVSDVDRRDAMVRKETRSAISRSGRPSSSESGSNASPAGALAKEGQPSTASPAGALAKAGQPSAVIGHWSSNIGHQSPSITKESPVNNKSAHDLPIFLSEQKIARLTSEQEKHNTWISRTGSNKKDLSGGMKLSVGKNVANKKLDGGSYFRFGFGLPLVQYYTSNPDQTFQLNYIPGLTGQYVINNHWGFGMNIFPYQKIPFSDTDSIYTSYGRDSSISPNNTYTKKYYLNNLNTWAAEINLDYRINSHLGIEGGFGFQRIWNAKGYVTTLSSDTIYNQPNQPYTGNHTSTQNINYTRSDQQLSKLQKANFYYYLNLVYQSEKWSVSLGYNQNGKSWFPTAPGKSPGWLKLQFNYYFSTGKK